MASRHNDDDDSSASVTMTTVQSSRGVARRTAARAQRRRTIAAARRRRYDADDSSASITMVGAPATAADHTASDDDDDDSLWSSERRRIADAAITQTSNGTAWRAPSSSSSSSAAAAMTAEAHSRANANFQQGNASTQRPSVNAQAKARSVNASVRRVVGPDDDAATPMRPMDERRRVEDALDDDGRARVADGASFVFERRRRDFFDESPDALLGAYVPPWNDPLTASEGRDVVDFARLELRDAEALERDPLYVFAQSLADAAGVPLRTLVRTADQMRVGAPSSARALYADSVALDVLGGSNALNANALGANNGLDEVESAAERARQRDAYEWLARTATTGTVVVTARFRSMIGLARDMLVSQFGGGNFTTLSAMDFVQSPEVAPAFAVLAGTLHVAARPSTWRRKSDGREHGERRRWALRQLASARLAATPAERARGRVILDSFQSSSSLSSYASPSMSYASRDAISDGAQAYALRFMSPAAVERARLRLAFS